MIKISSDTLAQYTVDLGTAAPLFLKLKRAVDYFTLVCGSFVLVCVTNKASFCRPSK